MNHLKKAMLQTLKNLKNRLGYVAAVSITMGVALGALLCVLSLIYTIILSPLPYPSQNNTFVANVKANNALGESSEFFFSYPGAMKLYNGNEGLKSVALTLYEQGVITSHPSQPTLNTTYVTPEYFDFFAPKVTSGRVFGIDETPGSFKPGAVLSYKIWREHFNSQPDIVGKSLKVRDVSFKILGVTAADFVEPALYKRGHTSDLWLTWDHNPINPNAQQLWEDIYESMVVIVQPSDNLDPRQTSTFLSQEFAESWLEGVTHLPFYKGWSLKLELEALQSRILGDFSLTAWLLLAATLGMTLIATANITNLFVSRTAEQQRTLAICAALGANKRQLFYQMLLESTVLMSVAAAFALIITTIGFKLSSRYLTSIFPRTEELQINAVTIMISLGCVGVFAILFAWVSSGIVNYRSLIQALQSSGKGTGIQVSKKLRNTLVLFQISVTFILVFANGILLYNSLNVINKPSGINSSNIIDISLTLARNPTKEEIEGPALGEIIAKALHDLPQVASVSSTTSPFSGFTPIELSTAKSELHFTPSFKQVDSNYFSILEQPLVDGRNFSRNDIVDEKPVAIVNTKLANRLSAYGSVIGSTLLTEQNDAFKVIGIVEAMTMPGDATPTERIYLPGSIHSIEMMLKLQAKQTLSEAQIVSSINEVTTLFSLFSMVKASELRHELLFPQYITAIISALVATVSFILAAIGLYGVINYGLQMRRIEIGTRIAIGAKERDLIKMAFQELSRSLLIGIGTGGCIVFALLLVNEKYISLSADFLVIGMVTLCCVVQVCLLASYLPLKSILKTSSVKLLRGQ